MAKLAATGGYRVISSGFIALAQLDPYDSTQGQLEIGRFTAVEEALKAAEGRGPLGGQGHVMAFETRQHLGGIVEDWRSFVELDGEIL